VVPGATDADTGDTEAGLAALVERLAGAFEAGPETLAAVAAIHADMQDKAPDLFLPVAPTLATAFQNVHAAGAGDVTPIHVALGEWALDAEGEPIERMRRDCLRFQNAMTRGVLRLHGDDTERCAEHLLAVQRFIFLQLALLASLAARNQGGGVLRTLPTPEYAAFMDILRGAIATHQQEGKQLALLLIQVAKVEQVDRLLGLQRGEAFMLRVTRRMREGILRKQDQLGRVSRDQFACLLPRIAGEGVAILAANKILGALEAPIPIGDRAFAPDAVIGIAVFPDHGSDPQGLVRNGKLAARAARETGEQTAVYDPAQGEDEELTVRRELRLRHALEEGKLGLVFEPQLDVSTGHLGGLRCSLRWIDEELDEVAEADALAAAESAGLVRELTSWIFNNGLRECAEFGRAGLLCPIELQVSASGLMQPDFPEFLSRTMRTWGVLPGRVLIGIHESALAGAAEQVSETLRQLKAFGLRLGINGFGTGSASVNSLAALPLDELKLSSSMVGSMLKSETQTRVVRALTRLACDLGLRVTAEGVNDGETALALMRLGCERVQGAYVSVPLTAREILEFEKSGAGLAKLKLSDL